MRKHTLNKTSKPCIYTIKMVDGRVNYIVRFSYLNKNYGQRNFTKLFGTDSTKSTFDKLQEVRIELSRGNNPFEKEKVTTLNEYFEEHINSFQGKTQYTLQKYYDKHVKPIIGNNDIALITRKQIEKILQGTLKNTASKTKSDLKLILNPIFKKSIRDKKRTDNPLEGIKFKKPQPKPELTYRVVSDLKFAAKELYRLISQEEDLELRAVLLIALMTARRRGEILKLKYSDIIDDKVFVPVDITKTKTPDIYPLPHEVLEIISQLPVNTDNKLFTVGEARVTRAFTRLISKSNIVLSDGSKFTLHDTRNLFQSIMIPETNNPQLVDRCISHRQDGSMMSVYLSFSYEKRESIFKKYWNITRI